jgi:hypothetical protein
MPITLGKTSWVVLPNEIIFEITKHVSHKDLLNARFVNKCFSNVTASFLFHSVTLKTDADGFAIFLDISESERLRVHIKEIACDSSHHGTGWTACLDMIYFLMAFPRIRLFRNLEYVTLRIPI